MTSARILRVNPPKNCNKSAFRFGGMTTTSLIASVDCLTSPLEGAFIAAIIERAGAGDYVEVGCAYGGTAILAAMTKKVFDKPGKVVTIDSFEGVTCSYEHAMKNITGYGLENHIEVVRTMSHPWPLPPDRRFVVGYVDGAHDGDAPYNDLVNMSKCVEKYILIHDYDVRSPYVVRGANRFADEFPEWLPMAGKKRVVLFTKIAR